jgi:hypothetical protein
MNKYDLLPLVAYQGEFQKKAKKIVPRYKQREGSEKKQYSDETSEKANAIVTSFQSQKKTFPGIQNPALIFELELNQSVGIDQIETVLASMGIHILSAIGDRKGYWVVFSDDENLAKFKGKLAEYGSPEGHNYDFFNVFGDIRDIPRDEKIGENLKNNPLSEIPEYIDIELWRMIDMNKITLFIESLKSAYPDQTKFRVTDRLITKSFALLRVKLTNSIFDEIIELKEVARAEKPSLPIFAPSILKNIDISEFEIKKPDNDATGILIIDSGIISNHPFLANCVGGEDNFQSSEPTLQDIAGHGTAVAGCSAYGDVEESIVEKAFNPSNWIFSAKVMYSETSPFDDRKYAVYDSETLVEHQLKDAVESFLSYEDYHIRVVNISLGNSNEIWQKNYMRQLPLAALIDELSYTYQNVVFIVSTGNQNLIGNYETIDEIKSNYPKYLINNNEANIINPATSALALTVGSIAQSIRVQKAVFEEDRIKVPIARENQPSPFTRVGPGMNGMIKPELVEYGGNNIVYENYGRIVDDNGGKLLLLNNQATDNLVRFDYGTSFSAPKVAHLAGEIANKFPQRTANFIKCLLLSGANYPYMPQNDFYNFDAEKAHLYVCGYGLPNLDKSINSFDNRVVLFDEANIQLNKVKVYSLQLPDIFFNERGRKKIIISLSFTPQTRSGRGDSYLGNRMEFHLFHTINPQVLIEQYSKISPEDLEGALPEEIKEFEISLIPGQNTRKAGCHQKAWKEFKREPRNRPASPVSLVLINSNKWVADNNTKIDYCLSVIFEHEKEIDLYNQIRANIQARARV